MLLGDMQPYAPMDVVLKDAMELTEVWWIPGNHDSDSEEYYERLWKGPLANTISTGAWPMSPGFVLPVWAAFSAADLDA